MAKKNRIKKIAPVKQNQIVEGDIIDITFLGLGVLKFEGFPIFIENALPGETVEVEVTRVNQNFAYGKLKKIIKESENRVKTNHKGLISSGIAPLVNLKYSEQLNLKRDHVKNLFKKGGIDIEVDDTVGMDDPSQYRNKTVVPVKNKNGKLITGFYKRGSHDLVEIDDYFLNFPEIDDAIVKVRDALNKFNLTAYDDITKKGSIRYIMVRQGLYTKELMVVLVSATNKLDNQKDIIEQLRKDIPNLKSVVLNFNPRQTNVLLGQKNYNLFGKGYIEDKLLDKKYKISPNSFYQVNPYITEKIYNSAIEKAKINKDDVVVDAYSGIGTIAISTSKKAKEVIGVEVVEQAVKDAEKNAKYNEIDNVKFIKNDAPDQMQEWKDKNFSPDVVFVDPPRKGLTSKLINSMTNMNPERIVYISCNPDTLVRDAKEIIDKNYKINQSIMPLDQFPHTMHIESITVFERE